MLTQQKAMQMKATKCHKCLGTGRVKRGDKELLCQACRGTGKAASYSTK